MRQQVVVGGPIEGPVVDVDAEVVVELVDDRTVQPGPDGDERDLREADTVREPGRGELGLRLCQVEDGPKVGRAVAGDAVRHHPRGLDHQRVRLERQDAPPVDAVCECTADMDVGEGRFRRVETVELNGRRRL